MNRTQSDRERFEQLYNLNRRDLLAYFLRRTDTTDAADLLAETFLVAWRRIAVVPAGSDGRLWLFGVARNQLRNHQRTHRTSQHLTTALQAALSEPRAADSSTAVAVREALEALNAPDREVMMLTVYEELTPGEIAEVTGRSAASIRVRLHRARRRVARELYGADRQAVSLEGHEFAPASV